MSRELSGRAMAAPWTEWQSSAPYSVGLEEEVMLLDAGKGWALARRVDEVLSVLPRGLGVHITAETQNSVLELASHPHRLAQDAATEAVSLRAALVRELEPMGLRAACAGTHPSAVWTDTRISGGERQQAVYGAMRELARREPTFGLHVHVGVTDPEGAIQLYNRMRTHLPLLLALSANSPYWQGRDTGLASARTPIFQAFPRVGVPRSFDSYEQYAETVDLLIRCRAIPDPTYLWWDVRPQPRLGTVEIRIMDVQATSLATHALVALVQAVAHLEMEEGFHTDAIFGQGEILIENRFSASRDGMDALLIDAVRETPVPAREALQTLIQAARPHAQQLGSEAALDVAEELGARNGAQRQRDIFRHTESLVAVVAALADDFER